MEVVFIDPEPPDAAGGGIRTYIRLAMEICRGSGDTARVYTHNPDAFPGEAAFPIGRRPWLRRPIRGLAYRLAYGENALWEHAYWLNRMLAAEDTPGRVYEFCDFLGYGFFALRNPAIRARCIIRVHTPNFLVAARPQGFPARMAWRMGAWRERDCLKRARRITVPSAEFIGEKLPWLRNWTHVPNPLPPESAPGTVADRLPNPLSAAPDGGMAPGSFPKGGESGWNAAPEDPAALAERNAPRPTRIEPDRFLYLGRVEERKGVLILVRAFLRLAAERPYATLTLVGGAAPGPYAAAVRYLIESLPPELRHRVSWEQPCPPQGRAALFRRFTVLAAPSLWENSPYVYFEGMAAGLPCIGSATGEMKAVAAATGALSPLPGDEQDWLRALRAHCSGADRRLPARQFEYLRDRRAAIPGKLLETWRAAAEGA
jgi:glycosyltransferase involved in cell wall biosynthesis